MEKKEWAEARCDEIIEVGDMLCMIIPSRCRYLNKDGLCSQYTTRPQHCKNFPSQKDKDVMWFVKSHCKLMREEI
jgi:Fe-S-cluster containining protein